MALPSSISPIPIVDAIADLWFESNLPDEALFGMVYQALKKDFPSASTLAAAAMPAQLKQLNPAFAFQPSYRLEGERLVILIGSNNVAVGLRGQYPGWPKLKSSLLATYEKILALDFVVKIQRFGLRYVNFFPGDIFPALNLSISLSERALSGRETYIRTILRESGLDVILQINQNATLKDLPGQIGSVIDMDAFQIDPDSSEGLIPSLSDFLDLAHSSVKLLFFELLKPEFVNTLNPEYQ